MQVSMSLCSSGGDFSWTFSSGYIITPVGGDKWLSLWINHSIVNEFSQSVQKNDTFENETSDWVTESFSSFSHQGW